MTYLESYLRSCTLSHNQALALLSLPAGPAENVRVEGGKCIFEKCGVQKVGQELERGASCDVRCC